MQLVIIVDSICKTKYENMFDLAAGTSPEYLELACSTNSWAVLV